jgi:hypothetical protein
MNIIDYMVLLSELNDCLVNKEKAIFDFFKVEIPEGHVLILPEKYLDIIGTFSEKIIFSPYIEEGKGYILDKSKMDNILNSKSELLEEK